MASAEPLSLRLALMAVLDEFITSDLERFKFFLLERELFPELGVVRRHKLETNERVHILTAMLDHYGIFTIDVVKIVLEQMHYNNILQELSQSCSYKPQEILAKCMEALKSNLREMFEFLKEGAGALVKTNTDDGRKAGKMHFYEGYIKLFITEGESGQANREHEVLQMERDSRSSGQTRTILCQDIFKGLNHRQQPIRVVLTKGVAGVGKTVLTQKFSLDWAEGRANQDIQLLFHLSFRELNELQDTECSLWELLHKCCRQTEELFSFQCLQLLFILDGLDECRFLLDFSRSTRVLTEPTQRASLAVLLVNLIRGDLLPFAHIWITTRPAAATQIPEIYISIVTEVRGFTDEQKDLYFKKRFPDERLATAVISHIKKSRSLYIMCHIAVFCWILCDVLLHLMKTVDTAELPTTLTQMYIHFLVVQAKVMNQKYNNQKYSEDPWTPETRKMVWSLGKLAFEQLLKGRQIFYKSDLSKSGLDVTDIAFYSVFTEVLITQCGQGDSKVYSFIHLSMQEFLAALHVHHIFFSSGENLLLEKPWFQLFKRKSPESFYYSAVDQALQSPNGHLDLFLRFLLGLSLSTNQELLRGLLTETGSDSTTQKTVKNLKEKLNEEGLSSERRLNLLHCLNELNDHSLLEEIQKVLRKEELSNRRMSPADWSAVSFILLSSDSELEEFELRKYQSSEEALLGLLPLLRVSTRATLSVCNLTENICAPVASALSSSTLTQLDLNNNDLQDSGVELLCEGLKSAPCRLEILWMSGCMVSERGGASLAAALNSSTSSLRELDLSYNNPGPSAALLKKLLAPHGPLQTLRLDPAGQRFMVPGLKKYACKFSLWLSRAHGHLHLSEDRLSVKFDMEPYSHRSGEREQVLSSTGLKGCCYWEVDWKMWSNWEGVDIGVCYRGIRYHREGSELGSNGQSWSLRINSKGEHYALHNGTNKRLPGTIGRSFGDVSAFAVTVGKRMVFLGKIPAGFDRIHVGSRNGLTVGTHHVLDYSRDGRVGVFLDHKGGALSFYDVISNERLSHIYTFSACFTEDLFPGFGLSSVGDTISVVQLKHRAGPDKTKQLRRIIPEGHEEQSFLQTPDSYKSP